MKITDIMLTVPNFSTIKSVKCFYKNAEIALAMAGVWQGCRARPGAGYRVFLPFG
jgi:hypothetical protein